MLTGLDPLKGMITSHYVVKKFWLGVFDNVQGAVPHILEKTTKEFFSHINNVLKEAVDAFYSKVQEIPCFICPDKPEGAMSMMVRT